MEEVNGLFKSGADKVVLNTHAFKNPELVRESAEAFGSQCIIVSMDCKKTALGYEVFIDGGKVSTGVSALEWAKRAEDLGAGELLVNSIDRDGMSSGFDFDLYRPIIAETRIPVIICGGVGRIEHFDDAYQALKPHALAAANIFHFIEQSYLVIKDHLIKSGVNALIAQATFSGAAIVTTSQPLRNAAKPAKTTQPIYSSLPPIMSTLPLSPLCASFLCSLSLISFQVSVFIFFFLFLLF